MKIKHKWLCKCFNKFAVNYDFTRKLLGSCWMAHLVIWGLNISNGLTISATITNTAWWNSTINLQILCFKHICYDQSSIDDIDRTNAASMEENIEVAAAGNEKVAAAGNEKVTVATNKDASIKRTPTNHVMAWIVIVFRVMAWIAFR